MTAKSSSGELRRALAACRTHFLAAAFFSLAINLLYLASPLYLLQVYNRVIPSSSLTTLLMLSGVLVIALATLAALDAVRARLLSRASVRLDRILGGRVIAASVDRDAAGGVRSQGLRDLDTIRQYLGGGSLQAGFDLPWVPFYIALIFALHPLLGAFAIGSSVLLAFM